MLEDIIVKLDKIHQHIGDLKYNSNTDRAYILTGQAIKMLDKLTNNKLIQFEREELELEPKLRLAYIVDSLEEVLWQVEHYTTLKLYDEYNVLSSSKEYLIKELELHFN